MNEIRESLRMKEIFHNFQSNDELMMPSTTLLPLHLITSRVLLVFPSKASSISPFFSNGLFVKPQILSLLFIFLHISASPQLTHIVKKWITMINFAQTVLVLESSLSPFMSIGSFKAFFESYLFPKSSQTLLRHTNPLCTLSAACILESWGALIKKFLFNKNTNAWDYITSIKSLPSPCLKALQLIPR